MILPPGTSGSSLPEAEEPLYLPVLNKQEFQRLIRMVLKFPNLGAGIDCSGTSGSGKSNFSQWAIMECLRLGIPCILIDPHGDSARKVWRMSLELPKKVSDKILFWRVADPNQVAGINPLSHSDDEPQLSDYERHCRGRVQVELTADVILAAAGEGAQGFTSRPVMRKWVIRWLWLLWNAELTLADAAFLLDPQHPIFELMVQLAPDAMSRYQLSSLQTMKAFDVESEIGSGRNRITPLLEHPTSQILLSRRTNNIDFRKLYASGTSLIVDLSCSFEGKDILTQEVQRLFANIILNQYLAVVLSTPEALRKRWMCVIDELPVFAESCGPLLERLCTEVRKFKTNFLFLHQGGARFPGRTDNEFLKTILDMCRVKLLYRHNVDAEFFGKQVALSAYDRPRVKHVQTSLQQLTVGHEIVELVDINEGESEAAGETTSTSETDQLTETLTMAAQNADQSRQTRAKGTSKTQAKQQTATTTKSRTIKQTIQPKIETNEVVGGIQFYSTEEIVWAGASEIKQLETGQAIVMVDGIGVWLAQTPEVLDPGRLAPRFHGRREAQAYQRMVSRPEFAAPEVLQKERHAFLKAFTGELRIRSQSQSLNQLESTGQERPKLLDDQLLDQDSSQDDPEITF